MIIPVRCISCGKPIGHLWEEYKKRTESGETPAEVMASLGVDRYCCRAMFLGHADLLPIITKFKKS
jgi:DNA-directed RNA polymerase subunit N